MTDILTEAWEQAEKKLREDHRFDPPKFICSNEAQEFMIKEIRNYFTTNCVDFSVMHKPKLVKEHIAIIRKSYAVYNILFKRRLVRLLKKLVCSNDFHGLQILALKYQAPRIEEKEVQDK